MKRNFLELPQGQIHYRTEGNGEPLLLLHQSPSSSVTFLQIMPVLGKHFQVIAMDVPGLGDSFPVTEQKDIPWYAGIVSDFLDKLGIKKTHILGHHGGALIACELAASGPGRVMKLILSAMPYMSEEERNKRIKWIAGPWRDPKKDGSHMMLPWKKLTEAEPAFPGNDLELATREAVEWGRVVSHYYHFHIAIYGYDAISRLPKIKSPTLLISGELDMNYPQCIEDAAKLVSRSSKASIPGCGPMVHWLKSEEYARKVLEFLKNT